MYPPPNIAKYVTPHGTGDHSGSSWSNAYSFNDMQDNLASNTTYYLIDSTFIVDSIFISNLNGLSFIGKGKTKTILQGQSNPFDDNPYLWSIKGFDLENADNITIQDIQIRKFRGFGIRVDAASSYFYAYNDSIVNCGWAAREDTSDTSSILIKSPCGVKLFGDDATFRRSYIMNSGWDGMQIAGYRTTVDSSIIYSTGEDEPDANHQGDGVHIFRNPDISYNVNGQTIHKAGRLTVNECYINTAHPKKSGIEAGYKDPQTEKPLLRAYNSYIAGGKVIDVTQDANPLNGAFYSYFENCRLESFRTDRPTFRIEYADAMPFSWIKNNMFYSPEGYDPGYDCPVGEYDTDSTAVLYLNNTWIKADTLTDFCVKHNAE